MSPSLYDFTMLTLICMVDPYLFVALVITESVQLYVHTDRRIAGLGRQRAELRSFYGDCILMTMCLSLLRSGLNAQAWTFETDTPNGVDIGEMTEKVMGDCVLKESRGGSIQGFSKHLSSQGTQYLAKFPAYLNTHATRLGIITY